MLQIFEVVPQGIFPENDLVQIKRGGFGMGRFLPDHFLDKTGTFAQGCFFYIACFSVKPETEFFHTHARLFFQGRQHTRIEQRTFADTAFGIDQQVGMQAQQFEHGSHIGIASEKNIALFRRKGLGTGIAAAFVFMDCHDEVR
ncbi:MAG: hypothetical protein IPJ82_15185 [Lewinellaceae bacterium]|nr:hypothetical protein [Lewinellaceae bacterium]